jgi:hypothetical protein
VLGSAEANSECRTCPDGKFKATSSSHSVSCYGLAQIMDQQL